MADNKPHLFWDLPGEIRNLVYADLVAVGEPVVILDDYSQRPPGIRGYRSWERTKLGLDLAILLVNRQARDEASVVLYSQNSFRFFGDTCFPLFLSMVGPHSAALLRGIEIRFPGLTNDRVYRLTSSVRPPEAEGYPPRAHPDARLDETSKALCDKITASCSGLVSITMAINATSNALARSLKGPLTVDDVAAGVEAIDRRLREIPTLETIVVKIYENNPKEEPVASVLAMMRRHGWIISAHVWGMNDKVMELEA